MDNRGHNKSNFLNPGFFDALRSFTPKNSPSTSPRAGDEDFITEAAIIEIITLPFIPPDLKNVKPTEICTDLKNKLKKKISFNWAIVANKLFSSERKVELLTLEEGLKQFRDLIEKFMSNKERYKNILYTVGDIYFSDKEIEISVSQGKSKGKKSFTFKRWVEYFKEKEILNFEEDFTFLKTYYLISGGNRDFPGCFASEIESIFKPISEYVGLQQTIFRLMGSNEDIGEEAKLELQSSDSNVRKIQNKNEKINSKLLKEFEKKEVDKVDILFTALLFDIYARLGAVIDNCSKISNSDEKEKVECRKLSASLKSYPSFCVNMIDSNDPLGSGFVIALDKLLSVLNEVLILNENQLKIEDEFFEALKFYKAILTSINEIVPKYSKTHMKSAQKEYMIKKDPTLSQ